MSALEIALLTLLIIGGSISPTASVVTLYVVNVRWEQLRQKARIALWAAVTGTTAATIGSWVPLVAIAAQKVADESMVFMLGAMLGAATLSLCVGIVYIATGQAKPGTRRNPAAYSTIG